MGPVGCVPRVHQLGVRVLFRVVRTHQLPSLETVPLSIHTGGFSTLRQLVAQGYYGLSVGVEWCLWF